MPDPRDHENVRRLQALYKCCSALHRSPLLKSASIAFRDGTRIEIDPCGLILMGISTDRDIAFITLDQVPGYIAALEGDVLDAQRELLKMTTG